MAQNLPIAFFINEFQQFQTNISGVSDKIVMVLIMKFIIILLGTFSNFHSILSFTCQIKENEYCKIHYMKMALDVKMWFGSVELCSEASAPIAFATRWPVCGQYWISSIGVSTRLE